MKTAISLPDKVYYEAEEAANEMQIPRSVLYVKALVEYLKNHKKNNITEKLNKVYGSPQNKGYSHEFDAMAESARESIGKITKDDTW
jgi:metal-responsive CopG/Arc/MetJ family transcriptional regulator